jgi:hypothetical protein
MNPQTETIAPVLFTIPGAVFYSGFARSRLYLEIKAGKLDVRKAGRRTLITRSSLDALLDALPKARGADPA